MRNISNIKGVLYAVVSSATFGLIPLFSIPLLHAGMASPTILFYRMLLSAAIMAAAHSLSSLSWLVFIFKSSFCRPLDSGR